MAVELRVKAIYDEAQVIDKTGLGGTVVKNIPVYAVENILYLRLPAQEVVGRKGLELHHAVPRILIQHQPVQAGQQIPAVVAQKKAFQIA